jgi:hypothetical protein
MMFGRKAKKKWTMTTKLLETRLHEEKRIEE